MLRILAVAIVYLSLTLAASASGWRVDRASGGAQISGSDRTWSTIQTGMDVPNGAWVSTGNTGRVMLSRGTERIMLGPQTLASVATWEQNGLNTQITQQSGSVFLDVETRRRLNTSVITPHLAAVVKGTAFEVTVETGRSVVRVERGRVQVRPTNSSRTSDITAGQVAWVNANPSPPSSTTGSNNNQGSTARNSNNGSTGQTVSPNTNQSSTVPTSSAATGGTTATNTPAAGNTTSRTTRAGNGTAGDSTTGNDDGNRGVGTGNGGGNGTANEGSAATNDRASGNENRADRNEASGGNATGNDGRRNDDNIRR